MRTLQSFITPSPAQAALDRVFQGIYRSMGVSSQCCEADVISDCVGDAGDGPVLAWICTHCGNDCLIQTYVCRGR